jgi:predicted helicase
MTTPAIKPNHKAIKAYYEALQAKGEQSTFGFMAQENVARVERQREAPITIVIGNPPCNANQVNENDNNKNRKYDIVDGRIRATYAKESKATLKNKLYDPYVKFIRWATDRLNGRDGVVCMVTNNSFFVDGPPFDGMRKALEDDYPPRSAVPRCALSGHCV